MARARSIIVAFVPAGVQILAGELRDRDKDDVGFDDDLGKILTQIGPTLPLLIDGDAISGNAGDRTMLAIYEVSRAYLQRRGKLPREKPVMEE